MEILPQKQQAELLKFLQQIKSTIKEWLFVDVKLTEQSDKNFTIADAAALIADLYKDKQGKIYICTGRELLMLLWVGGVHTPAAVINNIEGKLPPGSCEARGIAPTPEGLTKIEIVISYKKPVIPASFAEIRVSRAASVVLIADDDMFMRNVVKKMLGIKYTIFEAPAGDAVMDAYLEHVPDILFLDVHLPGIEGKELLRLIKTVDPEAYIIMMSADSSMENVKTAVHDGARGFLAKPIVKEKLHEFMRKCRTIVAA
jgi:two-component system, chemotaxis family, chemotaxis protein CheY